MEFRTIVKIDKSSFSIEPESRLFFVGSCFAENIGRGFVNNMFSAKVNPYGTMYNPASVLHTVERAIEDGTIGKEGVDVAVITLGTNHVYILKETGEIVDNCQKKPQNLFREEELTIEECHDYLVKAVKKLHNLNPNVKVIVTVSPIRYAKYGFPISQLSKATLLLAANKLTQTEENTCYFPAYEIMNDELRDYRFYKPDMIHPSEQAVEYIFERFADTFLSDRANEMIKEWLPIKAGLNHRAFDLDSKEHQDFLIKLMDKRDAFFKKYGIK